MYRQNSLDKKNSIDTNECIERIVLIKTILPLCNYLITARKYVMREYKYLRITETFKSDATKFKK